MNQDKLQNYHLANCEKYELLRGISPNNKRDTGKPCSCGLEDLIPIVNKEKLQEKINKQLSHVFVQGAANASSVLYASLSSNAEAKEAGERIREICAKYTNDIMAFITSNESSNFSEKQVKKVLLESMLMSDFDGQVRVLTKALNKVIRNMPKEQPHPTAKESK